MTLHQTIKTEATEAMKARESVRVSVLRGLLSAFTNEAVSKGRKPDEELADEEALAVVSRQVKQRKDSIDQYEKGGRPELAEEEKVELTILEAYLPEQMSEEEVEKFVSGKLDGQKPDPQSKGRFMGEIMKDLKGKADGATVKKVVDSLLS